MNFGLSCLKEFVDGVLSGKDKELVRRGIVEKAEGHVFDLSLTNRLTEEVKAALTSLGYKVIDVVAKVDYKAITGTSEGLFHLVFEVGLNYDEVLDIPYIPGSVIKGVLRNNFYSLTNSYGDELFGGKENEGYIIVSDAYPVGGAMKLLTGDIINPHYYKGGKPVQSEYDVNPVPIIHLAVREGVKFRFLIGVDKGAKLPKVNLNVKDAVELVSLLLLYSMKTGLGARSTKGYGFFEVEKFEVV